MVLGGRLIFTLVLQCIALSLANQNLVPIFISKIDTFLRTDHEKAQESSVFACVKRCVSASDCKSINYKKQGGGDNCFLNKKNRKEAGETAIEANQDFVYYNIDYHTQRSEEPEFGTSNINMPTVPPVMTVGACVSSPCQNGGTCVEHSTENGFHCNCTESFNGTRCELPVEEFSRQVEVLEDDSPTVQTLAPTNPCDSNPCKNGGVCTDNNGDFQCICLSDFTGVQCEQPVTEDFELIFGETESLINRVTHVISNKWFGEIVICAWIFTPGIADNQTMTVISMITENPGSGKRVLTVKISGLGGFHITFGAQRSDHPSHFSASSPKDSWVFLCVRFYSSGQPNMQAIVNADFNSAVSRNDFPFDNVQITEVVIGANQGIDKILLTAHPLEGKISSLNIWQGQLNDWNLKEWYKGKNNYHPPTVEWKVFANPAKRFGNVYFVSFSSALRAWRNVTESELAISKSSNVTVDFTADEKGVVVQISQPYLFMCPDQDSYPVDGVLILVPGNWKRISFKQTFLETQECYAIFGSVPSWVSGIPFNAPGVEEFDPFQDELWLEQFLGDNGDEYSGDNALCGSNHFWMVNDAKGNIPIAGVSLRRKNDAVDAGISTYGKCGMFKFSISDIRVLD